MLLTSSSGLVPGRGAAGITLTYWVDGDDPELVVDKGSELQDDRVEVSRVRWQVLPPTRLPAVLFKLDQELWGETGLMRKTKTGKPAAGLWVHVFWKHAMSHQFVHFSLFKDPVYILQPFSIHMDYNLPKSFSNRILSLASIQNQVSTMVTWN